MFDAVLYRAGKMDIYKYIYKKSDNGSTVIIIIIMAEIEESRSDGNNGGYMDKGGREEIEDVRQICRNEDIFLKY